MPGLPPLSGERCVWSPSRGPPPAPGTGSAPSLPNGEGGVAPRCRRHLPSPLRCQLRSWLGRGLQGAASCSTGGSHANLRKRSASHPGSHSRPRRAVQGQLVSWARRKGGWGAGAKGRSRAVGSGRSGRSEGIQPRAACARGPAVPAPSPRLAGCAARRRESPAAGDAGCKPPPEPPGRIRPHPSRPHVALSWQMYPESRWERGRGGAEARDEGAEGRGERGCPGPVPLLPGGGREPALRLLPGRAGPSWLPRGRKAAAKGLRRGPEAAAGPWAAASAGCFDRGGAVAVSFCSRGSLRAAGRPPRGPALPRPPPAARTRERGRGPRRGCPRAPPGAPSSPPGAPGLRPAAGEGAPAGPSCRLASGPGPGLGQCQGVLGTASPARRSAAHPARPARSLTPRMHTPGRRRCCAPRAGAQGRARTTAAGSRARRHARAHAGHTRAHRTHRTHGAPLLPAHAA